MLAWFVDNANVVYVILGLIVLGLAVSWWLNRRVRTLAVIAGVVGLGALFWLLTLWIPTDRKQIQANVWAMRQAVLDRKPDDLAAQVAEGKFLGPVLGKGIGARRDQKSGRFRRQRHSSLGF